MKSLLINTLFLMSIISVQAQWKLIYQDSTLGFNNHPLEVLDRDNLILIHYGSPDTQKSTDGGVTWTNHSTPFTNTWLGSWYLDIDFPTSNVGYVSGGSAFGQHTCSLVKTTDAGITWDSVTSGYYQYDFRDIHFFNADTGIISSYNNLLRTLDGGENFTEIFPNFNSGIYDVYFNSNAASFVSISEFVPNFSSAKKRILMSNDFGTTWNQVYEDPENRWIRDIFFLNDSVGFAVGYNLLLKTTNSGANWTSLDVLPDSSNTSSVYFINDTLGFINLNGGISKTIDGGLSWQKQQIEDSSKINQIIFDKITHGFLVGYAVGDNGIYKMIDSTVIIEEPSSIKNYKDFNVKIFPNPSNGIFNIKSSQKINEISVYNSLGRLVKIFKNENQINLTNQPKGVYTIEIQQNDNVQFSKIIIE